MTTFWKWFVLLALSIFAFSSSAQAAIATFDDLTLPAESYWNGEDDGSGSGTFSGFTSGDNYFVNYQTASSWSYWDGFAYSNMTDTTTAGYTNQFSAITGGGVDNSANYAVSYTLGMSGQPAQTYNGYSSGEYAQVVSGFYTTNTTYAYLSMLEGDGFAKQFGGDDGTDEDWFKLTIHALDDSYAKTGNSVDFYLADFRFADGADDYIIDEWTWVDLSSLGAVYGLEFELSSSDGGSGYSMNTPGYFAMDNFTTVPVPGAMVLMGSGLLALVGLRRRAR
jgi:hypothetical protein